MKQFLPCTLIHDVTTISRGSSHESLHDSSHEPPGCFRGLHSGWSVYFFILMSPTLLFLNRYYLFRIIPVVGGTHLFLWLLQAIVLSYEFYDRLSSVPEDPLPLWLSVAGHMMLRLSSGQFLSEGVAGTRRVFAATVSSTRLLGESATQSPFQTVCSNLLFFIFESSSSVCLACHMCWRHVLHLPSKHRRALLQLTL